MTDEMNFDLPDDDGEEDIPDWLAKLQTGNLYDKDVSPKDEDENLPDWLDAPEEDPAEAALNGRDSRFVIIPPSNSDPS